jgi:hypothetical protein
LQGLWCRQAFWNVCARQLKGVHDGSQFKVSNLYKQLKDRNFLQELVILLNGVRSTPYIIGDSAYPIWTYLQKNWKIKNPINVNKIKYDSSMNKSKVVTENAFDSLKNRWRILKHFHSKMDRTPKVAITCCVFHNFCEIWNQPKLKYVM